MTGPVPGPEAPAELSRWIRGLRPPKEILDPWVPQGFEVEEERSRRGTIDRTGTIFITNRECPFTCLMCDLWRYTTDHTVPVGAVHAQVDAALTQMPGIRHVKLYNAGNFFDDRAVSPHDRDLIAERVMGLDTVIVECHPRLVDGRAMSFRDATGTEVEVAMGLETVHPEVLPRLNKGMTLADFETTTTRLLDRGLHVRAFILLRPPFQTEAEGVEWAVRSLDFACSLGVGCCSIIPTRPGNGALDALATAGDFSPPALESLETVTEYGIGLGEARVFADLWDVHRIADCPSCADARVERLRTMNLTQTVPERVPCHCG
jgi:radical SAM enzyme (TIGR01210 family)